MEYRESLHDRLTVIHRRDAVGTTTDALLLAAFLPRTSGEACELGAGGGIVSLLAASRGRFAHADLVERDETLVGLCRRNIEENGMQALLCAHHADLREFDPGRRYSLVFFNPPYFRANEGRPAASPLADVCRFERAGGIADFCRAAARLLAPRGSLATVFPVRRRDELLVALEGPGLFPTEEVTILPYPGGTPKLLLLRAEAEPTSCRQSHLTLCRAADDPRPTDEAAAIYEAGSLPRKETP